jgi:hypothetical protein
MAALEAEKFLAEAETLPALAAEQNSRAAA